MGLFLTFKILNCTVLKKIDINYKVKKNISNLIHTHGSKKKFDQCMILIYYFINNNIDIIIL